MSSRPASKTSGKASPTRLLSVNERGGIAIWAALLAPAFMVVAALSVDLGRMSALENDLQLAADSYARAAAYELDGRPDAIERAQVAVARLVENDQRFGASGRGNIGVQSVRFLSAVPASDFDPITSDLVTSSSVDAKFAEVSVAPVTISTIFPVSLLNVPDQFDLTATAVAKTDQGICNAAPLFMCNPYEGSTIDLYDVASDRDFRRRQLLLKEKGGSSASYFPGNFGYLQAADNGAAALKEAMAVDKPALCYARDGVELRTGSVASVAAGFNTRFDIFDGSYKSKRSNPEYAPAPNVTKGFTGAGCNTSVNSAAMGLPRDDCFLTGTCSDLGGRMGDGDWDVAAYFALNHGAPPSITIGSETFNINYVNGKVTPEKPTRYEVYAWEIDNNRIPGTVSYPASLTPENGAPQCYTGGSPAGADRRVMKVAVLDCMALDEKYNISGSSAGVLPVKAFWKVFVTEPMPNSSENSIYGELIGPVDMKDEDRLVEVARVVR